tara:strand:+ start:998 stop:3307 length:2310 start_codon:yes stop_codon:yes gene_type:complete
MAEKLFTDIINNLGKARKEGKFQGGYRFADDGKLTVGGGYYDDDKMFEVEIGKGGGKVLFKKKFADGGRAGFKNGNKVTAALLKRVDDTQGVMYVPSKEEFKVRDYTRGIEVKDKRFKIKNFKTPALALQAAKKFHYDTVLSPEAVKKRIGAANIEAIIQKNAHSKEINKWTENWFKNNSERFSIKETDKAMKAFSDDFKKTDLYKVKGPKSSTLKSGKFTFPNIGTLASSSSARANAFKMNNLIATNLLQKQASPTNFFKSVFLSEKLVKDPQLKNAAAEYMKYMTEDKRGISYDSREAKLKNLERNPRLQEAISLLEDTDLKSTGKSKFFNSQFGNVYEGYARKAGSAAYNKHIELIEKTLGPKLLKQMMGTTSIKTFMLNERKALQKLFDTTKLTAGKSPMTSLGYSTEHVLGIADIARMKNKKEMVRALNTLSGMTVKKNAYLGRVVFNNNRKFLINQIDKGIDPKTNLTKLNKLINKYTNIKGTPGKIVNGKFKYNEAAFKTTTQNQRFKQYFTELYNIPEGKAEIIRQAKNNSKLAQYVGIIENNRSANGLYSFPAQMENIQIPESVKKALKVAGKVVKVAGKATGIIEPMFAAYNFSDAVGQGAGLKNSGQYMVEKFFEDIVNIPGLAIGATKYGLDKLKGKGTKAGPFDYLPTKQKFKTPYDATFARDELKENLSEMPKSQKLRNIANKDFDTGLGAAMSMVDVMEIPASKQETEEARQKFLKNQMGPYYKYGIETLPRKKNLNLQPRGLPGITSVDPFKV